MCLDQRGLDYNAEASNAALKEILLAHLKRLKDSDLAAAKMAASDARLEGSGLEDSHRDVVETFERLKDPALFEGALRTLRLIDPATVTQHLGAVVARLEDSHSTVRYWAL